MSSKAKGAKKIPEKHGLDTAPVKDGKQEVPKESGPAVKKKVTHMKEMFPDQNLNEKVLADSIRTVGPTHTVDLVMTGQLQTTAWHTVEKKQLEKKKEEAENNTKGGKGGGRGAFSGGRGRGFEPGRPSAMRPYSNTRPIQTTTEKTEGVGGVVKVFAPVSVNTTTSKAGLSFADMLKKSAAATQSQPPPPAPVTFAPPLPPPAPAAAGVDKERAAHWVPEAVPQQAAPIPAWPQAKGVWAQKAKEEVSKPSKVVEQEAQVTAPQKRPVEQHKVPQPEPEEPQHQEAEEEEPEPQPEAELAEEEPEEEPAVEAEEEPEPEEEVAPLPAVQAPEPPAPVAPTVSAQPPQQPRQATAYRPPAHATPVPERVEPMAQVVAAAAAPRKPAPRPIPQFSSEASVVIPSHLQSKADHGFRFEAPEDEEEEEEHAPVVAAVEQVIAEPVVSSQDVQTDPFMWEAAREAAMGPPIPSAAAPEPSLHPAMPQVAPAAPAPQPPSAASIQPPLAAPAPIQSPGLSPVQPPVVPAAAAMMHPPSALPSQLPQMGVPAPTQQPQQSAAPQPMPSVSGPEEPPYLSGMSGSDLYFGTGGGGPPPTQAQSAAAYSPPPFPGMEQGYPEPFGAYGAAYGRGKFPPMPTAHQQPAQPQQAQQQQQQPSPNQAPGSGQDMKAQARAAPGPSSYGKPPGQPMQPPMQPPMPGYGMNPYMNPYASMYGMYGMYGGMQGMPQAYDPEAAYGAPGFDASKFHAATSYYNQAYPPPVYGMPYGAPMRPPGPPWGGYSPAMAQGMSQDPSKYQQAAASSQSSAGQGKSAPGPSTAANPAGKFGGPSRAPRGFGGSGGPAGYQPQMRYDPGAYPPYYPPPQSPAGYGAFYSQHQQPHSHQQPGPQ